MMHAELLGRLLPHGAYDLSGRNLAAELAAEGAALDDVLGGANTLLRELDPRMASATLADWERVLGLSASGLSLEQRRVAAGSKYYLRGGCSRPFFIELAARLGFPDVTITEYKRANCNAHCNSSLCSDADLFAWTVNVPAKGGFFSAGCNSNCNSALGSWGYSTLENELGKYRPAHTRMLFNYV